MKTDEKPNFSLTFQTLKTASDLEKVLQKVNGTKFNAEDFLSEAEALLTAIQGTSENINILYVLQMTGAKTKTVTLRDL